MGSIFDNCSDSCGWTAGIIAAIAYGCFGVPIKETAHIDVHPLILQSYKTGTMSVCCWFVLAMGVDISFTPWGILSGFLWVLGGTGGIYAIRMAGMAISVGTWASVMICVNFIWGILIFQEPVASIAGTMGAFCLLGCGLVGMSWNSSPMAPQRSTERAQLIQSAPTERIEVEEATTSGVVPKRKQVDKHRLESADTADEETHQSLVRGNSCDSFQDGISRDDTEDDTLKPSHHCLEILGPANRITLFGVSMTRHQAGICGAVFNGLMAGSSLLPLHFARKHGFGGARYMISYATGALLSNCFIWFCFVLMKWREVLAANVPGSVAMRTYASLPSWHFRKLWLPGVTAGRFFWSRSMQSSSVFSQSIPQVYYSRSPCLERSFLLHTLAKVLAIVLCSLKYSSGTPRLICRSSSPRTMSNIMPFFLSGLWGIFWYKEISGLGRILKWFVSATLTVLGIICLSYERLHAVHKEG